MKLDWAMLANHFEVQNGLAYMNGGSLDTINVASLPATFVGSLALRLTLHPTEVGDAHRIDIRILAEDGQEIAHISGQTQIAGEVNLPKGWDAGSLIAFNLIGLQLTRVGLYSVEILLDGSHAKSLPFRVVLHSPETS